MDGTPVAPIPNSPVQVETLPADALPPRVTASPYGAHRVVAIVVVGVLRLTGARADVLQPVVKDAFAMPPFVLQDHMPARPAVKPLLDTVPGEKELCNAFKTPQEKIDVGCTWHQHEPGSRPVCVSSHTPTSVMGQVLECDPVLANNLKVMRRVLFRLPCLALD